MQEEAATLRAQAAMERKKCEQLRSEIQAQRSVSVRRWKPLDHNDCIQAYERCGPAKLAEMKKQTAIAKDAQLCKQEIFFGQLGLTMTATTMVVLGCDTY